MGNRKLITIKDVAKKADVSIATVSRVLNNPSKVKGETLTKVNKAIEELKFSCNSLHLKTNNENHKCVAIYLPTIEDENISEIARGALEELEKHNLYPIIWNSNENTLTEMRGFSLLQQYSQTIIQGAIFITSCIEDIPLDDITEIPIVAIERSLNESNIDFINVNAEQGMDLLIEHLYSLGHRNIGFLCGDITSTNTITKTMAYKKALYKKGIEWDASTVISTGWSIQCGFEGVHQLLNWRPQTTAIICINDRLAIGAINGVRSMGYSCPEDISITGFENIPSSAYYWPRLTALNFPSYEMGQMAAKKIIQRLEKPELLPQKLLVPLELIKRDSTGIAKSTTD